MERAEKIGLGVASAAHVLLFAALSSRWIGTPDPLKLNNAPIEVSIADEVALESAARKISAVPPPPAPGEIEGPPELAAPAPAEPAPELKPVPEPKPEPRKVEQPKPDKTPATKSQPTKSKAQPKATDEKTRGSKLKLDTSDWMKSASRSTSADAKPTDGAMASSVSAAQKSALDAEIRRQLKPHWKAPTGADAESLRTIVTVRLAKDGSITGNPEIEDTLGVTPSNQAQVRLHQEQAIKAIRLAAPFNLPANLYPSWNFLRLTFDKRLSQ